MARAAREWATTWLGSKVVGIDIKPQPHYPFEFHRGDALEWPLAGFDVIHASPPCQQYSRGGQSRQGGRRDHPDLIAPTRARLLAWGGPYVIENVERAPLKAQVMLCGTMFGLLCRKHRWFEVNRALSLAPADCYCQGRSVRGELLNFHNTVQRRAFQQRYGFVRQVDAMRFAYRCMWMSDRGLTDAIPPPYTEWVGGQLLEVFAAAGVA